MLMRHCETLYCEILHCETLCCETAFEAACKGPDEHHVYNVRASGVCVCVFHLLIETELFCLLFRSKTTATFIIDYQPVRIVLDLIKCDPV